MLTFSGGGLAWSNAQRGWFRLEFDRQRRDGGSDFLGTTDNEPLQLRANNILGLELYPGANNTMNLAVGPGALFGLGAVGVNVLGGYYGGFNTVYPNYSTIAAWLQ